MVVSAMEAPEIKLHITGITMKLLQIAMMASSILLIASVSYAQEIIDPCMDLSNNIEWNSKLQEMQRFHEKGLFMDALDVAQDMARICSKSPVLNYYMGIEYQGLNDEVKALNYLQRASDFTTDLVVPPSTAKQIWYARYEAEFPTHTQNNIDNLNREIESLNEKIQNLSEISADYKQEVKESEERALDDITRIAQHTSEREKEQQNQLYTMMWTGIGLGIGGATAAIVSGMIMLFDYKDLGYYDKKDLTAPEKYTAWAFIGGGAALLISGSIVAGMAGSWYNDLVGDEEVTLSFKASPNYIGVSGSF